MTRICEVTCTDCLGTGKKIEPCPTCGGNGNNKTSVLFVCTNCRGERTVETDAPCPKCEGTGKTREFA
ncbi:MAG TPA: hypothetical protein VMX18_00150 [Candidatus Bipolaricaulota bacterium]|nr:hypothetical protein [Candidatus Bipolaricaulota bacterium]